jgi:transcriptional regulator with XRE-family HTH domain
MRVFTERLLKEMQSLGLRQSDLARITGYDKVTINRWIHEKQSPPDRDQEEIFKKLDAYRRGGDKEVTSLDVDEVSAIIQRKLNEKFAEVISLGVVPIYVMEKLKGRYNRDENARKKLEVLLEGIFEDKEDYDEIVKWLRDVRKEST